MKRGLDEETIKILITSVSSNTTKQYEASLKFWWSFCIQQSVDPLEADEQEVIRCLTVKYKEGASYATLNTLRSAIALINVRDNSDSKLLTRFFKASFLNRPPTPRYNYTWDPAVVLDEIKKWGKNESLDLERLSYKVVMLLALGSAFRCQSLALIKLSNIKLSPKGAEILITDRTKTSRRNADPPYALFPLFAQSDLCIARVIQEYIQRTANLRLQEDQLLISFQKPHQKVTSQTVGRWLKKTMSSAGIEEVFTAHSTRHAATSKAKRVGVNIETIKRAATWSPASQTFARFYDRPIREPDENFAAAVVQ